MVDKQQTSAKKKNNKFAQKNKTKNGTQTVIGIVVLVCVVTITILYYYRDSKPNQSQQQNQQTTNKLAPKIKLHKKQLPSIVRRPSASFSSNLAKVIEDPSNVFVLCGSIHVTVKGTTHNTSGLQTL